MATGRSDFPNQVNNCSVFPGIFRGALDVRATDITKGMKIAAAEAIANFIADDKLEPGYIIPHAMDFKVPPAVAAAVAKAAVEEGVARIKISPEEVAANTLEYLYEGHLRHLKGEIESTR